MKFSSEVAGNVTGIRFYKAAANTGTHVGSLWSASGELLAHRHLHRRERLGLAAGELLLPGRDHGQHDLRRRLPRAQPDTTPSTALAFAGAPLSNPPLQALASPVSANGVYADSATSTFPTGSGEGTNYWVDVDFLPMPLPGQVDRRERHRRPRPRRTSAGAHPPKAVPSANTRSLPTSANEAQPPTTVTGTPPLTHALVEGLTNGVSYTLHGAGVQRQRLRPRLGGRARA